eukprot:scaffold76985_cov31-Tisochrysis_lutea.AAC.1
MPKGLNTTKGEEREARRRQRATSRPTIKLVAMPVIFDVRATTGLSKAPTATVAILYLVSCICILFGWVPTAVANSQRPTANGWEHRLPAQLADSLWDRDRATPPCRGCSACNKYQARRTLPCPCTRPKNIEYR